MDETQVSDTCLTCVPGSVTSTTKTTNQTTHGEFKASLGYYLVRLHLYLQNRPVGNWGVSSVVVSAWAGRCHGHLFSGNVCSLTTLQKSVSGPARVSPRDWDRKAHRERTPHTQDRGVGFSIARVPLKVSLGGCIHDYVAFKVMLFKECNLQQDLNRVYKSSQV